MKMLLQQLIFSLSMCGPSRNDQLMGGPVPTTFNWRGRVFIADGVISHLHGSCRLYCGGRW